MGRCPARRCSLRWADFNDDLIKAGIMKDADGLKPTSYPKRVRLSGAERSVIDSPFTPISEQVAGYWI